MHTGPGTRRHTTPHKYCNDQITMYVMGRTCSIHGTDERYINFTRHVREGTLKTFIRKVSGSISAETLTALRVSWYSSVAPIKFRHSTAIRQLLPSFKSLPIHQLLYHPRLHHSVTSDTVANGKEHCNTETSRGTRARRDQLWDPGARVMNIRDLQLLKLTLFNGLHLATL